MGNSSATGHVMNTCGCTDAMGFDASAEAVISMNGIQAWVAKDLVKDRLRLQHDLASRSRLREIPVMEGLRYVGQSTSNWWSARMDNRYTRMVGWSGKELTRDAFVQACMNLLIARNARLDDRDRYDLVQIFDSMDFDGNHALSVGEWAGGLSVFFKGTKEECVHAVFEVLDRDGNRTLSKPELQEYLKPFVKAMSPREAESLRPILLKKATDDIYAEMDMDHNNQVSSEELLLWTNKGNTVIDRLASIIDTEVYKIWLKQTPSYGQNFNQGYNVIGSDRSYPASTHMSQQQDRYRSPSYAGGGDMRSSRDSAHSYYGDAAYPGYRDYRGGQDYNSRDVGNIPPYGGGPPPRSGDYPYDPRTGRAGGRDYAPNNSNTGSLSSILGGVAGIFGTGSSQQDGTRMEGGAYQGGGAYNNPPYHNYAGHSSAQSWAGDHRHIPAPPPPPPRMPRGSYGTPGSGGAPYAGYGGNYAY